LEIGGLKKTDEFKRLHKEKLHIFLLHLIKLGRLSKNERNVIGRGVGVGWGTFQAWKKRVIN